MQSSIISNQAPNSSSFFKTPGQISTKRDSSLAKTQSAEVVVKTESMEISSGYDLTQMTSEDMLGLAKSFYAKGNTQDFLSLAVYSARAALEDNPDPYVKKNWTTPRNENGTFNLLAEIQANPKYSTGPSDLDAKNEADRKHLLDTLLSLPVHTITIEQSSVNISV